MKWFHPKNLLDNIFEYGIIIKGVDGLIELIAGFVLLFLTPEKVHYLVNIATHDELSEEPHAFLSNLLLHSTQSYTSSGRTFLIVYLWIHAVIKLVSVIGILRNKLWAYPFSLITLSLLTIYQLYEIVFVKVSILMIGLTVFDLFIIWLIWREFKMIRLKKSIPADKK